ncbi:hypothetical protein ARMGADRAFT_1037297 [Armillaria gallica]|uniref:Uncharacterized protein n=1 Tax=Armillaria gallica TaxID=47427 RepID=A0A2H3CM68_ARMGA|nr:hypothetical protein ARMGADRAFT_1037297 [Armillaria gallica]
MLVLRKTTANGGHFSSITSEAHIDITLWSSMMVHQMLAVNKIAGLRWYSPLILKPPWQPLPSLPLPIFNDRVHPRLHVDAAPPVSSYDFLPIGPFTNEQELITSFWEKQIQNGPGETAFAVYDKSKSDHVYAGIITYINSSVEDLVTEISFVMILWCKALSYHH